MPASPNFFLHGGPGMTAELERRQFGATLPVHWWDQPHIDADDRLPFGTLVDATVAEVTRLSDARRGPVDLLAGVERDAEFLAINPAGSIPAIQDGNVTMVESIAIMEYLMARYGPTRLAPDRLDPAFPAYQQFLQLGEAGLAASIYFVVGARNSAPEGRRQNWSAGQAQQFFNSRLGLVTRQLARSPYLAGETFTAADISVTYALELAQRAGGATLGEAERAYVARTGGREAYKRAIETCRSTKAWAAQTAGQ